MPRRLKNFKIRPAKFLYATHLKYQRTGTYTGQYTGPPVSEQRLKLLNRRYKPPSTENTLLSNILGSPLSRRQSVHDLSAKHGDSVYLFRNHKTNQVVYSLTGHLDPEHALPQLTFYGKKTIPAKYRRDDWRPYAAVQLENHSQALWCYWYLKDLRVLRDYAWRQKGSSAPPKEIRKKKNMNQSASSVCDMCTAIEKVRDPSVGRHHHLLVQWKVVQDLADQAQTGALAVVRKQIARGQRVLNSRKKNKKFPNPTSRLQLQSQMKLWYKQQTMLYKAMAAVERMPRATLRLTAAAKGILTTGDNLNWSDKANRPSLPFRTIENVIQHELREYKRNRGQGKSAITTLENPIFEMAHGIQTRQSLAHISEQMIRLTALRSLYAVDPELYRLYRLGETIPRWQTLQKNYQPIPASPDFVSLNQELQLARADYKTYLATELKTESKLLAELEAVKEKTAGPREDAWEVMRQRLEEKAAPEDVLRLQQQFSLSPEEEQTYEKERRQAQGRLQSARARRRAAEDIRLKNIASLEDKLEELKLERINLLENRFQEADKGMDQVVHDQNILGNIPPVVSIFWSATSDRKYCDEWAEDVTHMPIGPRAGRDQYFLPRLAQIENEMQYMDEAFFVGNAEINEGIEIKPTIRKQLAKPEPFRRLRAKGRNLEPSQQAVERHYSAYLASLASRSKAKAAQAHQLPADVLHTHSSTGAQEARV